MRTIIQWGLLGVCMAMLPSALQAQPLLSESQPQWEFATKDETVTITKYVGAGGAVTIPGTINGLPVVNIGEKAFFQCTNLTSVTVPISVTRVGAYAFGLCNKLLGVYFMSNAPSLGEAVFFKDDQLTVYYLPGTTGWDQQCGDRPTAKWNQADPSDAAGGRPSK